METELVWATFADWPKYATTLKRVCDQHGYSAPSFGRAELYSLLVEHAADFQAALTGYVAAVEARRAARS